MSSIDFEQDKTKDLASADNAGELINTGRKIAIFGGSNKRSRDATKR